MRMMPKIRVSPTPKKNNSAACDSALRLWVTKNAKRVTGLVIREIAASLRSSQ